MKIILHVSGNGYQLDALHRFFKIKASGGVKINEVDITPLLDQLAAYTLPYKKDENEKETLDTDTRG